MENDPREFPPMTPFADCRHPRCMSNAVESNVETCLHKLDAWSLWPGLPWDPDGGVSELAPSGRCGAHCGNRAQETIERSGASCGATNIWGHSWFDVRTGGRRTDLTTAPRLINPEGAIVFALPENVPFLPYEAGIAGGTEFCVFDGCPVSVRLALYLLRISVFPETDAPLDQHGRLKC